MLLPVFRHFLLGTSQGICFVKVFGGGGEIYKINSKQCLFCKEFVRTLAAMVTARFRRAPNVHQQMCTTRRPFQRPGGLLSNHPNQKNNNNKLSNEKVHCRKVSATFSRSLKCGNFQGKYKNAIFSRTVFANEKTHLGPTLNTCKVGAWRAARKNFHSLLFSAQRLVHVCWCTLGAL